MRKSPSNKHQAVNQLKMYIRLSRKLARQVNRKLESLAEVNKMKAAVQKELVKLCNLK